MQAIGYVTNFLFGYSEKEKPSENVITKKQKISHPVNNNKLLYLFIEKFFFSKVVEFLHQKDLAILERVNSRFTKNYLARIFQKKQINHQEAFLLNPLLPCLLEYHMKNNNIEEVWKVYQNNKNLIKKPHLFESLITYFKTQDDDPRALLIFNDTRELNIPRSEIMYEIIAGEVGIILKCFIASSKQKLKKLPIDWEVQIWNVFECMKIDEHKNPKHYNRLIFYFYCADNANVFHLLHIYKHMQDCRIHRHPLTNQYVSETIFNTLENYSESNPSLDLHEVWNAYQIMDNSQETYKCYTDEEFMFKQLKSYVYYFNYFLARKDVKASLVLERIKELGYLNNKTLYDELTQQFSNFVQTLDENQLQELQLLEMPILIQKEAS